MTQTMVTYAKLARLDDIGGSDYSKPWLTSALVNLLALGLFLIVIRPFFSGHSWMLYEQDDFFYYLKVAQNLAQGHGSTFNGIVQTNGYHPLWMMLLVMLSWLTTNPTCILAFLAASIFIAGLATYFLFLRLLGEACISNPTRIALAICITLYSVKIYYYCMETTLAVPLVLAAILLIKQDQYWRRGMRQSAVLGLLLSAMVLSRLDTLLLAGILFLLMLAHPRIREGIHAKQLLGATAGLTPLIAYFLSNHFLFHTWLPISGMAKQLKFNHLPTMEAWKSLAFVTPGNVSCLAVILLGIALLPVLFKRLKPTEQVIYPVVLVFPFLYIFILSCLSDWRLWGWYLYVLRPALCIGVLLLCLLPPVGRFLSKTTVTVLLLLFVFGCLFFSKWPIQDQEIYQTAVDLQNFAASHPGTYAMGDRAGKIAYLLPDPVIQLEGLVMDRSFLGYIKRQSPLRPVLKHYGVRYYIATSRTPLTGCFHSVEPAEAGPNSSRMEGTFCRKPVATYMSSGIQTLVFDLDPGSRTEPWGK